MDQGPIQKIPNLLRPQTPPPADPAAVPRAGSFERRRFWKLAVFDALAVVLAGALGYNCLLYFSGGVNFTIFIVIAALFLLASFFDFLLTRDPRRRAASAFLQILAFLAFFYATKWNLLLVAFAILLVFYFLAERSSTLMADNSVRFRLWPVAQSYMKKIFIGLALATIVLYLPQGSSGNIFVSRERFGQWYGGVAEMAQRFYSGFDFNSSVGAFTEGIVRAQIASNPQFRSLPPNLQEEAVRQGSRELIANTARSIGFTLTPDMPLAEAFYRYILGLFAQFQEKFGQTFLAVWGVALFVIVWSLGTVFIWLMIVAAFLVYELLAALNLVRIVGETRTKETIELA